MDIRKLAHEVQEEVVAFRRDLHMHPEASMQEFRTSDQIARALDELGVSYRRLDPTGIIAEVTGRAPGKTVALRGDIDALSIQEKTDVSFKSINDGMMHACGHDTHASMLLGAVKVVNSIKDSFDGTVRFIFQPAEEICEGAKLVIAQGGLEDVYKIFGIHIGVMKPIGQISGVRGASHAATDTFKITIKGKATHGAAPHSGMDATVCGAAMVMNLQTMVSREFPPLEPLVVTVGSFYSGSRFNIISGEAVLEGTIRSFSREVHKQIPETLRRIVEKTCETYRCTCDLDYKVITGVLVNDDDALDTGFKAAKKIQDPAMVIEGTPTMGGEDFSEYTAHAPAAFYSLGAGGNWPGHSDHFEVDESAFEVGVALYVQMALDALAE